MQDSYVGYAGDFAKYLLLKELCKDDFILGINWYFTTIKSKKDDGKHFNYLKENCDDSLFYKADPKLFNDLKQLLIFDNNIIVENRTVAQIEKCRILPPAVNTYKKELDKKTDRPIWFQNSIKEFSKCNIVFCDPDNGLEIKNEKSIKHTKLCEIIRYYSELNCSVILYQHQTRDKDCKKIKADKLLSEFKDKGIKIPTIRTIYCGNGTGRFFFIIMQDKHKVELGKRIDELLYRQRIGLKEIH